MDKKWLYLILVVVAIGRVAAGYFYYGKGGKIPFIGQEEEAAIEVKEGLGAEALLKTNNPLSNELPETNPFKINTNPFK